MWSCRPTSPGITVWPLRSNICAPAGMVTLPVLPTALIRSPVMSIVWSSLAGVPVPSTSRTCVSATTGASTVTKGRAALLRFGRCAASGIVATKERLATIRRMRIEDSEWRWRVNMSCETAGRQDSDLTLRRSCPPFLQRLEHRRNESPERTIAHHQHHIARPRAVRDPRDQLLHVRRIVSVDSLALERGGDRGNIEQIGRAHA